METWIALLRGINVGGKNLLPMKELRALLGRLGLQNVQTYIQSGNCVFDGDKNVKVTLATTIAATIKEQFGFRPEVMMITKADLNDAIMNNPYPEGNSAPKRVHFFFMSKPAPNPDLDKLQKLCRPSEKFTLSNQVFYLYAPDGVGRSKLVAQVEKCLGVPVTARNLKSVKKIAEMASNKRQTLI